MEKEAQNEAETDNFQHIEPQETRVTGGIKMTSVQMTFEDWQYCKAHKLQFSELMRVAIAQDRAVREGHIVNNVIWEREKREKFQEKLGRVLDYIEEKGLTGELFERFKNGI